VVKTIKFVFGTVVVLAITSTIAVSQCQDQTCGVNASGCFACQGAVGQMCQVVACDTCTIKLCSKDTNGGSHQGPRCQDLPFSLPKPSLALVPVDQHSDQGKDEQPSGFLFVSLGVKGSPATLTSITFDKRESLVKEATLANNSSKTIVAYSVGWIAAVPSKDAVIQVGPVFEVPAGVEGSSEATVPALPFPKELIKPGVRTAFFVAKVRFADGSTWHADLRSLKKKALSNERKSTKADERNKS